MLASIQVDSAWPGEARPKQLATAGRQTVHLARLVDDLLDVARVTHGKLVLRREQTNLVEVLRGALEVQEANACARGLTMSMRATTDVVWVDADRERLAQVFTNLLLNAIKYTLPGGRIDVVAGVDGAVAVVEVADTGVGLAPPMIDRIFDVFAQADVTIDRSKGGIGIGLALVQNILKLHGGEVDARSAGPGQGSTFRVRLPLAKHAHDTNEAHEPDDGDVARKRRIVLVDDNEDLLFMLQCLIEKKGHEVLCAADGPGGVERILEAKPDLAFVDLGLPGFDGLEVARRVRAAGSPVRLIALSGCGLPEDKRRASEAGFDEHISKPVAPAEVAHALSRGARRSAAR